MKAELFRRDRARVRIWPGRR